ncbi:MazG-like family protein [Aquibacillus rhizosphaerae]|uniref:MazG-like family protein n=1 Tax=Aquibacillus rhizosphaerae TaxID=3051431 RepID=A0ABT7L8S3_9BACI|nr:MazG-like family protein [Aquibacillus sp. LR5S19]MDL4842278.1 MazG-like family protein [Aquibacillus sp. LR5S19]
MKDIQNFLSQFQKDMNWQISGDNYEEDRSSLLNNYMLLTTEVAEVAEEMRSMFNATARYSHEYSSVEEAFDVAKQEHKENLGKELSDCIAYIVKLANYFDIDLETSIYSKTSEVKGRINKDQ